MRFRSRGRSLFSHEKLGKVGYTDGCVKCQAIKLGDHSQDQRGHTAACRARVEKRMSEDPALKQTLQDASRRQDEFLARRVEVGDPDLEAKRRRLGAGYADRSRGAASAEGGRSRASSVHESSAPELPADDVDAPVPTAAEAEDFDSHEPSAKRAREDQEGELDYPVDREAGCWEVPEVLMLGQKKLKPSTMWWSCSAGLG